MDPRMNAVRTAPGRPRIGIDAAVLRPPMSGVERAVQSLVGALGRATRDFEFIIYYPRSLPKPPDTTPPDFRYRHPLLPNRFRFLRILWEQTMLPFALRRDRVDLLHAPAYVAPRFSATPLVLTIYDAIALRFPNLCKRVNALHYRLLMPSAARRALRVIVPSECTRRDVVSLLGVPEERIRVVPLGVSAHFRPIEDAAEIAAVRRRYGLPELYVLYVGNLEPKKNLPHLIRALAASRRTGRLTHRLVIAGRKAWHTAELRRTIRTYRLHDAVVFPGEIRESDLPALYSGASLFVFPSLYEGFGLPPLEAMACGTPVVATRAGALPEVLGNAALLLSSGDVRQLRIAMEKVMNNRFLRNSLRARGIERAKRFTWENTARKTLDVYAEILAPKRIRNADVHAHQ